MNLDPRSLLFSIFIVYALSVLSLFVAGSRGKRDGMSKWALAMLLETLLWMLIATRGLIPDVFSVIVANGLKATSNALILAAICEFQQRQAPRWHYFVPVALMLLMVTLLQDDIKARFIWGGLIYGFQMALIARELLADKENRGGRAWRLLFSGVIGIVIVLGIRAGVAIFGHSEFGEPQGSAVIQPFQLITYIAVMATALLGSIGFVLMVKERTDREVMHLAMTDSLTQVPNRRALMDYARRALARRSGFPLALMMIDVDHFKNINDTDGHPVGDMVLCEIARLLSARLRGYDFLGRYGGEEFCVIAPETDAKGALTLAEDLRAAIDSAPISIEGVKFPVSISIGISLCPSKDKVKLEELLTEADAALYSAKQSGRNRSVCFEAVPG